MQLDYASVSRVSLSPSDRAGIIVAWCDNSGRRPRQNIPQRRTMLSRGSINPRLRFEGVEEGWDLRSEILRPPRQDSVIRGKAGGATGPFMFEAPPIPTASCS